MARRPPEGSHVVPAARHVGSHRSVLLLGELHLHQALRATHHGLAHRPVTHTQTHQHADAHTLISDNTSPRTPHIRGEARYRRSCSSSFPSAHTHATAPHRRSLFSFHFPL